MKKILTLFLCFFLLLTNGAFIKAEETIAYVDPSGNTAGAYQTLQLAAESLPSSGGKVVVVSDAPIGPANTAAIIPNKTKIVIEGANENIRLTFPRVLRMGCEMEFNNITLANNATASGSFAYIYCQGNNLTIGDNVTVQAGGRLNELISIFAGYMTAVAYAGNNQTININSGDFKSLYLGNNPGGAISGSINTNINNANLNTFVLSGLKGNSSAAVNVTVENSTINNIYARDPSSTNTVNGQHNILYHSGTINNLTNEIPNINLSNQGTINITSSNTTVGNIVGGGTINLLSGASLIADDLSGEIDLNITSPIDGNVYLTINNINSSGVVNYENDNNKVLNKNIDTTIQYIVDTDNVVEPITTVYVDPSGNKEGAYTSIDEAANALSENGGTIILSSNTNFNPLSSGVYTFPDKPLRIVGESDNISLILNRAIKFSNDAEIDNLILANGVGDTACYIYALGNNLTIGSNVSTTPYNNYYPYIFAGGRPEVINADNQVITINSGHYGFVFCGGFAAYSGNLTYNFSNCIVNKLWGVGSGASGTNSANVTININNSTITTIVKKNGVNVNPIGNIDINLLDGNINIASITDLIPDIDLSSGGNLTLGNSLVVDELIGGGSLELNSEASLTANSFTGNIELLINNPSDNHVYLTVNDVNTNGTIEYTPKQNEELIKNINTNDVTYIIEGGSILNTTNLKVYYYNPDDPNNQPLIVLYKGHAQDSNKVLITNQAKGNENGKNYIEEELQPGLYYFRVYYSDKNNGRGVDYITKYIYITGSEEDLIYDYPYTKFVENNYEEDTTATTSDQVIDNFFNTENLNIPSEDLVTPSFTRDESVYIRRFINNDEICEFIDNLNSPYLHVYYPFALSPLGNKSPVLVFTKDEVDANTSLVDLANEVNSKGVREILMINGGQHGNEESGIEGNLQLAYDLCGEYGEEILDKFGAIVLMPIVSADCNQRFSRHYEDGCNSNKDVLLLEHEGSQNYAYIYRLFMPTSYISCHEDNDHTTATNDYSTINDIHNLSICAMMVPNGPIYDTNAIANGSLKMSQTLSATLVNNILTKANNQGFIAQHYSDPQYTPLAERSYATIRGSLAFLIEINRIWSGKAYYKYCVNAMTTTIKNVIEEIVLYNDNHEKTIAMLAYEGRQNAKVNEFDEDNYFILTMKKEVIGNDPHPSANFNGEYVEQNRTRTYSLYNTADRIRPLPLSYIISADLENIDHILGILDMHGIAYVKLPNGTTRVVKTYSIVSGSSGKMNCEAELSENFEMTFENGAYEISLNTSDAYLIAYLFEPDCYATTFNENLKASFYKMDLINDDEAIYRYETDVIPTGDPVDITFMVDNSVYESLNDVLYNSLISEPSVPKKEGYVFTGWYKDVNCTNKWIFTKDRATEDKILYAGFIQGHKVTILNAGFNNSNNPISSSEWLNKTGWEINYNIADVVGDYADTTGVPMSIYTDLSDVSALKIKVGNNEELTINYTGTKITRYITGSNTVSTTGNVNSDIVKIVLRNDTKASLTSVRFYNINDDITFTFVHNTLNINYLDEENVTTSYVYDSKINNYEPDGTSYDVPVTSLANENDNKIVNLHLVLDEKVGGIKLNDLEIKNNQMPYVDNSLGKITVNKDNNLYDVRIEALNTSLIIKPIINDVEPYSMSGTLNNDGTISLNVNAYVNNVDEEAYVLVNNEKTLLKDIVDNNGVAKISTTNLAIKQLGDNISIRYYDGEDNPLTEEYNTSVKDYVYSLLSSNNSTSAVKNLCKALLNYAANAQEYFNYNADNLVNSSLDENDRDVSGVKYEDVAQYAVSIEGETDGILAYGQSLTLKNTTNFKLYFKLDNENISDYTFKQDCITLTPVKNSNNVYYVSILNTAAPDLDKEYTITVKNIDSGNLSVKCSVLTYAGLVLKDEPASDSDIKLANTMKAMYLYCLSAKEALGE